MVEFGAIDRLFWTLEFGDTEVRLSSLDSLFNLSCMVREARDQIVLQVSRLDQLGRCLDRGDHQLRLAACKLISAVLLDGSNEALVRLAQVAASTVPHIMIRIICTEAEQLGSLLLQLILKCITSFIRDGCFFQIHANAVKSKLSTRIEQLIRSHSTIFERLRLTYVLVSLTFTSPPLNERTLNELISHPMYCLCNFIPHSNLAGKLGL